MYDQLEADLHDTFWAAEGASAELPLIEKFLGQYPGTSLELGCGSGRLLLPLLGEGFFMEGLDNSADMLRLCRAQLGDMDPVLHHASMVDFQTGTTYGAITIPAFTLQFLPPQTIPDLLTNIQHHLHPGGGLYITTFIPWAEITGELNEGEWFLDQETRLPNGHAARCHTRFQIKRLSQELIREHRYEIRTDDGKLIQSSTSSHHLHWYWPREMDKLLGEAGFTIEQTLGDFDPDSACDENSQIITLMARANDEESVDY
ncbi:MAG: class I SAM-dependent methyltransferase [Verrucomicrobiae bacterium]|nr:class I SAM-dependent methyltransferase [Verrucomicrobiae bacterium]NNJ41800.1 class I SAM-dependent methyltransferase [Akkermansiaceae bacterium]